ncbi:MAG: CBS domain-containing protein [Pseudorhodoplanes sp.]|nr:CBS domain-containing protein [Pseudorhodoplanes sp.]
MNASDVMTKDVLTVAPDASILQAARIMLQNKVSGLPVVDDRGNGRRLR